jgi:hypothetical protein
MLPSGYLGMSREERIGYWVAMIYRQMRWAGEDGNDELSVFEQRLVGLLKGDEPEIDSLMPSILTYLSRMWLEAPAAFLGKVNARLGTSYEVDESIGIGQLGARVS